MNRPGSAGFTPFFVCGFVKIKLIFLQHRRCDIDLFYSPLYNTIVDYGGMVPPGKISL